MRVFHQNESCLACPHPLAIAPLFWWKESTLFKKVCRTMKGCAKNFAMKCFVFLWCTCSALFLYPFEWLPLWKVRLNRHASKSMPRSDWWWRKYVSVIYYYIFSPLLFLYSSCTSSPHYRHLHHHHHFAGLLLVCFDSNIRPSCSTHYSVLL